MEKEELLEQLSKEVEEQKQVLRDEEDKDRAVQTMYEQEKFKLKQYQERITVFNDDTQNFDYNLQEIELNPECVKIEAQTGPKECPNGTAVRHLLVNKPDKWQIDFFSKMKSKKWQVQNLAKLKHQKDGVFVIFSFNNPVLIRGLGIKSSSAMKDKNPMNYAVYGCNY